MKVSELPYYYKILAEVRATQCDLPFIDKDSMSDDLYIKFSWSDTPEGHDFWSELHEVKSTHQINDVTSEIINTLFAFNLSTYKDNKDEQL